jgi:hypothetical protein
VEEDAGAGGERKARVRRAVTGRHASARTVAPLFRRDEEGRRCTDVTRRNCCRRIHSPRAPVVPHPSLPVGRGARGGATEHLGWIRAGSRGDFVGRRRHQIGRSARRWGPHLPS